VSSLSAFCCQFASGCNALYMLCVMIRLGPILVTVEDARHDIVGVHLSILLTPEMSSGMCL